MSLYLTGVVVAAGLSQRLGFDKRRLKINDKNLVEHSVNLLQRSRLGRVVVVTRKGDDIDRIVSQGVTHIQLAGKSPSMLYTLQSAIRHVHASSAGVVVMPCDCPGLSPSVIERLIEHFVKHEPKMLIPRCASLSGHPRLISREMFQQLEAFDPSDRLSSFFKIHASQVEYLEVNDPLICLDVDTESDIGKLAEYGIRIERP